MLFKLLDLGRVLLELVRADGGFDNGSTWLSGPERTSPSYPITPLTARSEGIFDRANRQL
jgi:hypothetical protein